MKITQMKKKVLAITMLAASMLLVNVSANAWSDDRHNRYEQHNRYERQVHHQHVREKVKQKARYRAAQRHAAYQQWRRGQYLPVAYSPRYVVHNWRVHRLSAPPRGHEWLRINGRFVQVSVGNHRISRIW
jgi:Ni/Co efflux regulator RcnB